MTDPGSVEGVVPTNPPFEDQGEQPFVNNADEGDKSPEKSNDLQPDNDPAQAEETNKDLKMSQEDCDELVLRARGLPWSATAEDVEKFFTGCEIKGGAENGIHFTFSRDGRPSGECFIEFASMEDCQKALLKNNEHMGKRYVEVFESKHSEMEWVCKRMGVQSKEKDTETVVRLRGLPYGCSKEEVANFFKGLEIAPNGITIAHDEDGKNTGDAFVEFASPEIASQAMNKHKEKIGHRYIEIFRSSRQEARAALLPKPKPLMSARPGPYDRRGGFGGSGRFGGQPSGFERRYRGGRGGFGGPGNDFGGFGGPSRGGRGGRSSFGGGGGSYGGGYGGGGGGGGGFGRDSGGLSKSTTGHCIHMRGLPFSATEADVKQWFMPLNPVAIRMEFETSGSGARRSRGEADVDFASDADAKAAMSKDRQMMGHRYIELFLRSEYDGDDDWSGEQSFFSGNGMNFSGGGGFGNNFGNSSGGGNSSGNYGGGGGGDYGGGSGGGNFSGGNSNFGSGGGGGGSNYGGGYGGGSGQGGNYGNQSNNNMGSGPSFYGMQGSGQGGGGGGGGMMSSSGGTGYGNQGVGGGSLQSGGSNQSGYQQSSGYNQANQGQGGNYSTSAGAFNSSTTGSFYGQDSKTGMVSYPTY